MDGCPPLTDTLPDGVTPCTPRIGLELAIDLHVGLFDACVGAGVEGQLERTDGVPVELQTAVPDELLGEGRGETRAAQLIAEATELLFIVASHHRGLEDETAGPRSEGVLTEEIRPRAGARSLSKGP